MKVEITKKAPEPKPETPFVVGGVYRLNSSVGDDPSGNYRILSMSSKEYVMVSLHDGVVCNRGDEVDMRGDIAGLYTYVPNARLAIEE